MNVLDQIISHPLWIESYQKIQDLEKDRIFCKHDLDHFLAVGRLIVIELQKNGINEGDYDVYYAAALLHDIGRHLEYTDGVPHEEGSAVLASEILKDTDFEESTQAAIVDMIKKHRSASEDLLAKMDKLSRNCYLCKAKDDCKWPDEKKNLQFVY
jgi:uncharacterized protein